MPVKTIAAGLHVSFQCRYGCSIVGAIAFVCATV
jgi:hypothetical protein